MAGASTPWVFIVVLGGGAVVLAFIYVFYRLRLRRRDAALARDTTQTEEERAYNQIRIARAGADHLHREGYDIAPVRSLLQEAETAQKRRDHATALSLSDRAKQRLHEIRRTDASTQPMTRPVRAAIGPGSAAVSWPAPGSAALPMPDDTTSGGAGSGEAEATARAKLPPNQVEARFALTELDRDLARPAGPGDAGAHAEAAETGKAARAAYDRADYTEAWRLALRARRRLGRSIGSIGETRPTAPAGAVTSPEPGPGGTETGPAGAPCPRCGRPSRSGDLFCRFCGGPLAAGRCPRCGAKNESADRFCAVCGAPIGA
ncbi:MAG TPA: zinc ribbon domain-containing protein [Thermoplasmata archaeon]|nr:zinc ribbon domain-containing protein [Thermoplasmata archaeon]